MLARQCLTQEMVRSFWRSISEYAVTNSRDPASFHLDLRELDAVAVGAASVGVAGTGVSAVGESDIAVNTSLVDVVTTPKIGRRAIWLSRANDLKLANSRMYESPYAFIGLK